MRILALIEASTISGPAKNLMSFAAWASKNSDGPELIIVTFRRKADTPFIKELKASGLAYRIIEERGVFDIAIVASLRRIAGEVRPDIIQSHGIKSHAVVRAAGLRRSTPWIAFNHGYTAIDLKDRLYRLVDRWSLRAADMVITVCGPFARQLQARGVQRDRLRILHNSVPEFVAADPQAIQKCRDRYARGAGRILLSIGRLSSEKGQFELLRALGILRVNGRLGNTTAIVVGDGIDGDGLRSMASKLGIERNTVFAGHHRDVRPFFGIADVFVLPSRSEGSPNAILESMAARVPIVATAAGGVVEILDNEDTALVVPILNPQALADAIDRMLADEPLRERLKSRALSVARQRFAPDQYRRNLLDLYSEVLASRSTGRGK